MQLTVDINGIGTLHAQGVALERMIGGYELIFNMGGDARGENGSSRWLALHSARVRLTTRDSGTLSLGTARPEKPLRFIQGPNGYGISATFRLQLSPYQVEQIEEIRAAGDLCFDLMFAGEGGDKTSPFPFQQGEPFNVAQSDWIKQLAAARFLDVHLIEILVPILDTTRLQRTISEGFRSAQRHFVDRRYREAVADCRLVLEATGVKPSALTPLSGAWKALEKDAREAAMFAAIHFCMNPAHHLDPSGALQRYDRSEAKLLLTLTAACIAHFRDALHKEITDTV
jgi:hypothetical protein